MITEQRLKQVLHYDQHTGIFTWLVDRGTARKGQVAGCPDKNGYLYIGLDKKIYKAHRLAWLYVFGYNPVKNLDHINGQPADNRIDNLRECNQTENNQNRICKGWVFFPGRKKPYAASIVINKQRHHLGYFATDQEAHEAYLIAKKQLHVFNPVPR